MKKYFLIIALLMFFVIGLIPLNAKANLLQTFTVATFADPSKNSDRPLFTVDYTQMKFTGGWSDNNNDLILEIPYSGYTVENSNAFENAWFEMTDVKVTSVIPTPWGSFGYTGSGSIKFYEDNSSTDPLVVIDFETGSISPYSFGANEIFIAENVTITGSKIDGTLSQELFRFNFTNLAKLPYSTNWNDGFTATSSFTSSAVSVPEPATITMLLMGSLVLIRNKNK